MNMITFKKNNTILNGNINIYGDKEISIIALILSSIAIGESKITNLPNTKEIRQLIDIIKQLSISVKRNDDNDWLIEGNGINGIQEPINVIDVDKSISILQLFVGLLSSYDFTVFFKVHNNLSNINIDNILNILQILNVKHITRQNNHLPLLMMGNSERKKISFKDIDNDVLLKKMLLLSAITIPNKFPIIITEKRKTENHLEIMMKYFGIVLEEHDIVRKIDSEVVMGKEIIITGQQNFIAKHISIPADLSASAFIATLAITKQNSNIILKDVLMNEYRDSFYRILIDLGVDIKLVNKRIICGEKVNDIIIKTSQLRNTIISKDRVYKLSTEYPFIIFIATLTDAVIELQGIKHLKNRYPNDYQFILELLTNLGVEFVEDKEYLRIIGQIKNYDYTINLDDYKNISPNVILMTAMYGFYLNKSITVDENLINDYINIKEIMTQLKM